MLSKVDILKELGNGISVYPLHIENIKENSINLCASEYAWCMNSMDIYCCADEKDKNKRFSLKASDKHKIKIGFAVGKSAVVDGSEGEKYIILLPCSTTLIETKETLSLKGYLGGTYHSKVGLVSKGLGHIGTMVGPNFSGESLIAMHNVSNKLIVLEVGDSFVSVVFHRLETPYTDLNATVSGHTEKFSNWGIRLTDKEANELNQDWKKNFDEVNIRMKETEEYKKLQRILKDSQKSVVKQYLCWRNIFIILGILVLFGALLFAAHLIDQENGTYIWVDRYISVGCSGLFVAIVTWLAKFIKPKSPR